MKLAIFLQCACVVRARAGNLASTFETHSALVLKSLQEQQQVFESQLSSSMVTLISGSRPPLIPTKWVANVNQTFIVNGTPVATQLPFPTDGALPIYAVDSAAKRMLYQYHFKFAYAPEEYVGTASEWFNSTVFITNTFQGMMMNNNKYFSMERPTGGLFQDPFAWVLGAQDSGMASYKGRQLHRWVFQHGPAYMELLSDGNGVPVYMHLNTGTGIIQNMEFVNFQPNVEVPGVWDEFNENAFRKPLLCPAPVSTVPIKTSMYIFHPENEFNIVRQDLGDATGDVFFVCTDILDGQSPMLDHNYAWLTQWEIELVPHWGQYQNCNGYNPPQCSGLEDFFVGRESSNYIGSTNATARQCGATNPLVGAWWSLPAGGRCLPGHIPGDGSCTWRERRVKTIDGKCLIGTRGFKAACQKDGRGPFPSAMVLFLEAFASEDSSQGGCPNIVPMQPAACSWNSGCVGLSGDCCPTSDGTMLACCDALGAGTLNATSALIV